MPPRLRQESHTDTMPFDGDVCNKLGTYKNGCCDQEVVVAEGAKFPRCRNHPNKPTEWKFLPEPSITRRPDKKR